MPLTPQEQAELDTLERQALESQAAAYEASQAEMANSQVDPNRIGKVAPPQPRAPMTPVEMATDMAKSAAIQGGFTATGQTVGAATGLAAPVAVPFFGSIFGGAGYMVDQARKGEDITAGGLVTSMAASAIPGAGVAAAGAKDVAKQAVKQGANNFLLKNAETLIDEGRVTDPLEAFMSTGMGVGSEYIGRGVGKLVKAGTPLATDPLENTIMGRRNEVFRDLRKEGFGVPPHELGRGSDLLSSVGGKAALQQTFAKKNQDVSQRMINEDLGIIANGSRRGNAAPIYDETLENVRKRAASPYEKIQEMQAVAKERLASLRKDLQGFAGGDPMQAKVLDSNFSTAQDNLAIRAAADVEQLKLARAKAHDAYRAWRGGDPAAYTTWKTQLDTANGLEDTIDEAAQQLGDKKLLKELRQSRRLIAKTYAAQEAINPASGEVDPVAFGRMLRDRVPLDGKMKLLGQAQLIFNKEAVMASRVPAPGVDNMSTKFAISSAAHGSPAGTLAALAQGTVGAIPRRYYSSDMVQNIMAEPPRMLRPVQNGLTGLATFGTRAAGRDNPFLYRAQRSN